MSQRAHVEILSTREVWRAQSRKRLKRANSSLFSALQTSQVLNISTYAQLKHELIVFAPAGILPRRRNPEEAL